MTQGKMMLIIVLYIGLVVVVGEIFYRCEYRSLKRRYNLSDYGAEQLADRGDCYGASLAMSLVLLLIVGAVCTIITEWTTPIE